MISKEETKHIASLARLGINEKEEEMFQKDLSSVLDYFNSLKEVDTSSVNLSVSSKEDLEEKNDGMRDDEVESESKEDVDNLIKSFSARKGNYLKVRQIL